MCVVVRVVVSCKASDCASYVFAGVVVCVAVRVVLCVAVRVAV